MLTADRTDLTEDLMLERVIEHAKSRGVLPEELKNSEAARMFDVFKTNSIALENYTPLHLYDGAVLLFKAAVRSGTGHDLREAWAQLCSRVESRVIPGDHYGILKEPGIRVLAECLNADLDSVEADLKPKRQLEGSQVPVVQ